MACNFSDDYNSGAKNTWFFDKKPQKCGHKWEHQISTDTKSRYNPSQFFIFLEFFQKFHVWIFPINLDNFWSSFFLLIVVNPSFFKKCDPCKPGIQCVPSIQCPAHVRMRSNQKPQICDLPHGGHGFCCTTGRNFTDHRKRHFNY